MKRWMQFSLRTFLIVALVVSVILGLWINAMRQRAIEQELIERAGKYYNLTSGDFNIEKDFTDQQLIEMFQRYAPRAVQEPEIGNIAAHAMGNLVIRHHPKGIEFARQYVNTDVSPLWQAAVYCLLGDSGSSTNIEYETHEEHIKRGYDANTPLGQFILASSVHWDFARTNGDGTVRDNWHHPVSRKAYQDSVAAMEEVYPPAAKPYARVIEILQETNGGYPDSTALQDELGELSNQVCNLLACEATVLRHIVRNPELHGMQLGSKYAPWDINWCPSD